jgi:hypothetical protein
MAADRRSESRRLAASSETEVALDGVDLGDDPVDRHQPESVTSDLPRRFIRVEVDSSRAGCAP